MTPEEMVSIKADLFVRIRTALEPFAGEFQTTTTMVRMKAKVSEEIRGWLRDNDFDAETLRISCDLATGPDGSTHFSFQPRGVLAEQFVSAVEPQPKRRKLKGFDPVWTDPEPESDEGVPATAKPGKIWSDGGDPFLRVGVGGTGNVE